jgi:SAM-dependent methyltransferase
MEHKFQPYIVDISKFKNTEPRIRVFLDLLGNVNEKEILEIGCGISELSVYLAKIGGKVTCIDILPEAVEYTKSLVEFNNVSSRVSVFQMSALDISGRYDLIVGKYVLHHIEPFEKLAEVLFNSLKDGGRGVFLENSSANPILMFSRKYLAGRFGIPKYGDENEFPLEPREIEILKNKFSEVRLYFPEFIFFRKATTYLFHGNYLFYKVTKFLDNSVYHLFPFLRKYSYEQIVEIVK